MEITAPLYDNGIVLFYFDSGEKKKKPFESLMLVQAYNSPWLREYVQESGIKKANSRLFVETM